MTGQHAAAPRRRLWPKILLILALVVAAVVAGGGIYVASLAASFDSGKETFESVFPDESTRPSAAPEAADGEAVAQNILLLGSDTRGEAGDDLDAIRGQRADTIMVAHIPADRKHVYVMSIMRDSWVDIAGHGQAKVNAALSYGGVPLMVQTVESIINARIDHVALIDFEGFKGLTDALGGVVVNNPEEFTRGSTHYATGPIELDGEDALGFVRERYSFTDGDYQRVRNQQAYIKGVLSSVLSAETLLNPAKLSSVVGAMAPYLTVDKDLDAGYLAGLALQMPSLRPDDVTFFTAPTTGTGTSSDGQSIVVLDAAKLELLRAAFAADDLGAYLQEP